MSAFHIHLHVSTPIQYHVRGCGFAGTLLDAGKTRQLVIGSKEPASAAGVATVVYQPLPEYNGLDSFTYTVHNEGRNLSLYRIAALCWAICVHRT